MIVRYIKVESSQFGPIFRTASVRVNIWTGKASLAVNVGPGKARLEWRRLNTKMTMPKSKVTSATHTGIKYGKGVKGINPVVRCQ